MLDSWGASQTVQQRKTSSDGRGAAATCLKPYLYSKSIQFKIHLLRKGDKFWWTGDDVFSFPGYFRQIA